MSVIARQVFLRTGLILLPLVSRAALCQSTPTAGSGGGRPVLRIGIVTTPIRLDGLLDENGWAQADSIGNLTQIEPVEGQAPTGRTIVRVLTSGDAIVFGADDDRWNVA